MAVNKKLDRRHDINAGERLPERFTRVQDMQAYWDGIDRVKNNTEPQEAPKPLEPVFVGDLVYIGGNLQVVEEVLDSATATIRRGGCVYGGCIRLPQYMQDAWAKAQKELGI